MRVFRVVVFLFFSCGGSSRASQRVNRRVTIDKIKAASGSPQAVSGSLPSGSLPTINGSPPRGESSIERRARDLREKATSREEAFMRSKTTTRKDPRDTGSRLTESRPESRPVKLTRRPRGSPASEPRKTEAAALPDSSEPRKPEAVVFQIDSEREHQYFSLLTPATEPPRKAEAAALKPDSPTTDEPALTEEVLAPPGGLRVPLVIDDRQLILIALAGEPLLLVARRFVAAQPRHFAGMNCGFGDAECLARALSAVLLEEARRPVVEDAVLESSMDNSGPILIVGTLTKMISLLVICLIIVGVFVTRYMRRNASLKEEEVIAGQALRIAELSADLARGEKEALLHVSELSRTKSSTETTIASQQTQIDALLLKLEAKRRSKEPTDEDLREHNELLKRQLKNAGVEAIDEVVSFDEAKARLRAATERLLKGSTLYADERELAKWDEFIRAHPQHHEEVRDELDSFRKNNFEANAAARLVVRGHVPPTVWTRGVSLADLQEKGLNLVVAKRVFSNPVLWLTRASASRLAKTHLADLRGRYAFSARLSLMELRAVLASIPPNAFDASDTPKAEKRAWRTNLETKLRDKLSSKSSTAYPECYGAAAKCAANKEAVRDLPFDVDQDDVDDEEPSREEVVENPCSSEVTPRAPFKLVHHHSPEKKTTTATASSSIAASIIAHKKKQAGKKNTPAAPSATAAATSPRRAFASIINAIPCPRRVE